MRVTIGQDLADVISALNPEAKEAEIARQGRLFKFGVIKTEADYKIALAKVNSDFAPSADLASQVGAICRGHFEVPVPEGEPTERKDIMPYWLRNAFSEGQDAETLYALISSKMTEVKEASALVRSSLRATLYAAWQDGADDATLLNTLSEYESAQAAKKKTAVKAAK
jgi:hypothetical protein